MIRYWCICLVLLVTEVACCPIPCQCSSDLKVVNCTNPNLVVTPEGRVLPIMGLGPGGGVSAAAILIGVPQNLPHQMETLILSHNEIREIEDGAFGIYKNLKSLYMDDCQIGPYGIGYSSFNGLENLEKLVLSDNYIAKLPITLCQDLPNLIEIHLDNNKLTSFPLIDGCLNLRVESLARNTMACESSYQVWGRHVETSIPGLRYTHSTSSELRRLPQDHCMQRKFRYIPYTLLYVQKLDISGIGMDFLWNNTFMFLTGLQELNLAHNKLHRLENSAFSGLWELKKLDLSYNKIDFLSPFAFWLDLASNPQRTFIRFHFTHLSLRGNRIRRLNDTRTFMNMQNLTDLDLSDNPLSSISPSMFYNLRELKFLNLSNNDLLITLKHDHYGYIFTGLSELRILDLQANGMTRLQTSSLEQMPKLALLDVRDNVFKCDIHLFRLGHWANVSNVTVLNRDEILPCFMKNEDSRLLLKLPRWLWVEPETKETLLGLILCFLFLFICAMGWRNKLGSYIAQYCMTVLIDPLPKENEAKVDDAADFKHDIFISFSDSDRDFVEKNLLSLGTENNGPYRLWYDCPMGGRILTEISDAMKNSRMAVIVITDAYFQSRQKIDEFNELLFRQKENRNFQLAFVTYGDNLDLTKLPNVAHYPLTSSGFVAFSDQEDMKILRARLSARLDRPLTRWEKVLKAFNDTKTNIEAWYQFLRGIARAAMANNVEPA